MNDIEYLDQMNCLRKELERIASAELYDPVAHGDVIEKINELNHQWFVALDARRHIRIFVYIAAILFVLYLVYLLLSEL